jgi:hypothetical protein
MARPGSAVYLLAVTADGENSPVALQARDYDADGTFGLSYIYAMYERPKSAGRPEKCIGTLLVF